MSVGSSTGIGLETNTVPEGDGGSGHTPINPDDVDKEALDVATQECNKIFDEYDELDDLPIPGRP